MLLKNRRIFIVEDNPGNLAITSIYLEGSGAKIKFERWGQNTPQTILRNLPIDVILLDLMLPQNISGFDVFDQIRRVPELANIPIVAVSASDPDIALPTTRKKGFAGFISKPVSPHIARQIADVIKGKQVWIADNNALFD